MIDLARRLGGGFDRWLDHIVKGAGDFFIGCRIRAMRVIDHLIFMPQWGPACLEDEVFQSTISGGRLLPLPLQIKLAEFTVADYIAAPSAGAVKPAVVNVPAFLRKCFFLKAVPAGGRFAIKQQFPPAGFLLFGELIGRALCSRRDRGK